MKLFSSLLYAFLFWLLSIKIPAVSGSIDSARIVSFFDQYAAYMGLVCAFLSLLLMGVISGLLSLIGIKKHRFKSPLLVFLGFSPWAVFGYDLLYLEPRYANIAKAIIEYLGTPMWYSALLVMGFGLVALVLSFFKTSDLSSSS